MVASGNRLDILKALGDNTRYAIYLEIARSPSPLPTAQIADSLGLHANTVRPHLERMKEVGLLESRTEGAGTVGRPHKLYSLAGDAPSLGLEPPVFTMLARMLIDMARASAVESEVVLEAGRSEGRRRAQSGADDADDADDTDDTDGDPAPTDDPAPNGDPAPNSGTTQLAALARMQERLGFDPALLIEGDEDPERPATAFVAFTHCPFADLAAQNPEIVCALHRGLVEGFIEGDGSLVLESFNDVVNRSPCQMELSLSAPAT